MPDDTFNLLDRIQGLQQRLATYSPWEVAAELAIIWACVYIAYRFVQGTRAAGALKGLLVLVIIITIVSRVLGGAGTFQRLGLLSDKFLALFAVALVVIFQPELRRALVRLGETSFLRSTPKDIRVIVEEVADAAHFLSRAKFGALIVIERQTRVAGLVEGGTKLNAELSSRLLQTIFFPGSALHDLACVVKGRVLDSAGVQLPLADPADMPDAKLGSRHRAAVGLTQECDAIVVVVSEETGSVRLADRGRLSHPLSDDQLRDELSSRLRVSKRPSSQEPAPRAQTAAERRERALSDTDSLGETALADTPSDSSAGDSRVDLSGSTLAGDRSPDPADSRSTTPRPDDTSHGLTHSGTDQRAI